MVTTPKKVLIIDDSNTECLFMGQALQSAGYQVLIANDGTQGLRMLSQERPLCLVLDIVLPGMSGFDVCRQLRSQDVWRDLPIVIVSTKNSTSDRFWAQRQGANQYLSKPFKGDELVKVVTELITERSERANSFAASRPSSGPATRQQPVANPLPRQPYTAGPNPRQPQPSSVPFVPGAQESGRFKDTMPSQRQNVNESSAQRPPSPMPDAGTGPLRSMSGSWPAIPQESRPLQSSPAQNLFLKLIPRRSEHAEMLRANGPDSLFIADRLARQLYLAIDGKTNVEMLCVQTGLSREDVFKALRILVSQYRIQLVDTQGRLVDSFFLQ